MALTVCKFGGTSVATTERIKNVADRLIEKKKSGDEVVAVVSAMGKSTDDLVALAEDVNKKPDTREMDMLLSTGEQVSMALLAMAIQAKGYKAVCYTGWQAGIQTDTVFNSAKIEVIHAGRIRESLNDGAIVVVAGFQGITSHGDITTLGRGGSDTTAVALAYGLKADVCEIYSDVLGVYTADPRICPRAKKLDEISYDDMLELSGAGSGVLQSRAVEFAAKYNVVIHSRSAFSDEPGTLVKESTVEKAVITGIAHDTSEMRITIRGLADESGMAAKIFSCLANHRVSVDMIIQNASADSQANISFTFPASQKEFAMAAVDEIVNDLGASQVVIDEKIAKVSLVGTGMKSNPGVAARAFQTLADNEININMISTSPIRLSVVVEMDQVETAVQCLHTAFGLDSDTIFEETELSAEEIAAKMNKGR